MMAVRTGAWKDKNPGRSARRADKKAAMKSLVEDYYTMNPGNFFEAVIMFFNEFPVYCLKLFMFGLCLCNNISVQNSCCTIPLLGRINLQPSATRIKSAATLETS